MEVGGKDISPEKECPSESRDWKEGGPLDNAGGGKGATIEDWLRLIVRPGLLLDRALVDAEIPSGGLHSRGYHYYL